MTRGETLVEDHDLRIAVQGLHCASCVDRVQRALARLPGVAGVRVNLAGSSVHVAAPSDPHALVAAIGTAGLEAVPAVRELTLAGLHCAGCVGRVEAALRRQPGVLAADVNLAASSARVTLLDPRIDLAAAVRAAGYDAKDRTATSSRERGRARQGETAALARKTATAAFLAAPLVLLEMGGHAVPVFHGVVVAHVGDTPLRVFELGLTAALFAGPGRRIFVNGFASLWRLAPDMDALVALGAGTAFLFSTLATVWAGLGDAVYFEAAAVVVTLVLLGRFLEARARGRTGAAIESLAALQPERAVRLDPDGGAVEVAAAALRVGDRIRVKPGERVPADGTIEDGAPFIDESLLTGEAGPVAKQAGDDVTGGTVNGMGSFTARVTRTGADTALAQIVRMVERAQGVKLPVQALADRVTVWFVPAVIALAAATFTIWLVAGAQPGRALGMAVAVLVISCPCAMGLATPVSVMVAIGRAAETGLLFRRGETLQTLGDVACIAFDKTGTLTLGHPSLVACDVEPGFTRAGALALAASVEAHSDHPLARAVTAAATAEGIVPAEALGVEARPGLGISGTVEGHRVVVGSARLMREAGVGGFRQGEAVLHLAVDGRYAAAMRVADPVRANAAPLVAALKARGIACAMITGDARVTAEAVARDVGIDTVVAEVLPGGKVDALRRLAAGRAIAFVGDGINDAPVLAAADVGLAIGAGAQIAIEAADIVVASDRLGAVGDAVDLSRATLRNIRQNLFWAFAYNVALIPVAAGALVAPFGIALSPMLAAGAMACSSLFVVGNALRLRRFRPAVLSGGSQRP